MASTDGSAIATQDTSIASESEPHVVAIRDFVEPLSPPPRIPLAGDVITRPYSPKRLNSRRLVVPTLKSSPQYSPITDYEGLPLYRLCPAVPYLLGSVSLMARIELIIENQSIKMDALPSQLEDLPGEATTGRSRALLAMLMALQKSEGERFDAGIWLVQGLSTEGMTLRLYKDCRPRKPEVCQVDLVAYVRMVRLWHLLPNPINVSCDHPSAKTPWSYIAAKLREAGVDVSKIDKDLYQRLTVECHPANLDEELEKIKEWSDSGELETRYNAWQNQTMAISRPNTPSTTASTSQTSPLYSKRYTQAHPRGIAVDELQGLQRAEARRDEKLKQQEQDVEKAESELEKVVTFRMRLSKFFGNFSIVAKLSIILLVFFALVGGLVYSMSSANTSDWTQGSDS